MRKGLTTGTALVMGILLSLCSCERIEILDTTSNYKIETTINEDEVLYKKTKVENISATLFYNEAHNKGQTTYFGRNGGYLPQSTEAGKYILFIYSLDMGSTIINRQDDIDYTYFTTKVREETTSGKIYNEPSHVYAVTEQMELPLLAVNEEHIHKTTLHSICDSWRVVISGVKGRKNARKANMYISNQGLTYSAMSKSVSGHGVIYHNMMDDLSSGEESYHSDICTFLMPTATTVKIQLSFYADNGKTFSEVFDVTDQVRDEKNTKHIINIYYDITLEENKEGGLNPSAQEWEDHVYIFNII